MKEFLISACWSALPFVLVVLHVLLGCTAGWIVDRVAFGPARTHAPYQTDYRRAFVIVAVALLVVLLLARA